MSESTKLLKEILKTSHWTQEQLAANLGVSYVTVNSWMNGRTRPQKSMIESIRRLYLAQDITSETKPIFITLVNIERELKVGDYVILEKDEGNPRDDEAITASLVDETAEIDPSLEPKEAEITDDTTLSEIKIYSSDYAMPDQMYVANSVGSVARGTYSAGRIYDKFDKKARARVVFIHHTAAIAQVVDWNSK